MSCWTGIRKSVLGVANLQENVSALILAPSQHIFLSLWLYCARSNVQLDDYLSICSLASKVPFLELCASIDSVRNNYQFFLSIIIYCASIDTEYKKDNSYMNDDPAKAYNIDHFACLKPQTQLQPSTQQGLKFFFTISPSFYVNVYTNVSRKIHSLYQVNFSAGQAYTTHITIVLTSPYLVYNQPNVSFSQPFGHNQPPFQPLLRSVYTYVHLLESDDTVSHIFMHPSMHTSTHFRAQLFSQLYTQLYNIIQDHTKFCHFKIRSSTFKSYYNSNCRLLCYL